MSGQARNPFAYTVLRAVPRVERAEFINAGVVLFCRERRFLGARTGLDGARLSVLAPELSKGLEFDLVILIDPPAFGTDVQGAVDRYVAMTRATRQLVVLTP